MMGDFAAPHHGPSEPNESTPEENREDNMLFPEENSNLFSPILLNESVVSSRWSLD
jgi:hypothetical protein